MKISKRAVRNRENRWKYSFLTMKVGNCLLSVAAVVYATEKGGNSVISICVLVVPFTQLILNLCATVIEFIAATNRIKTLYLLVSFLCLEYREMSIGLCIPMRLGLGELKPVIAGDHDQTAAEQDVCSKTCLLLLSMLSLISAMMTYKIRDSILKAGGAAVTTTVRSGSTFSTARDRAVQESIREGLVTAVEDMRSKFRQCRTCGLHRAVFHVNPQFVVGDEECAECRKERVQEGYF